jgi:hypothetical protein
VKHAVEDTLGGGSGGPFKNIVDKYAGLAQQVPRPQLFTDWPPSSPFVCRLAGI